jgi:hypothetical protein
LLLTLCACIDEFNLDGDIPAPDPVIEGLVVNEVGESFVRISAELNILGVQEDVSSLVSGAAVEVEDADGNVTIFCEKSPGLYRPEDESFSGSPLSEYMLRVKLADGRSYRSAMEVMYPGVTIDSVFAIFKQNNIPNTEQLTGSHDFFISASAERNGAPVLFRTSTMGIARVAAYIEPPPPDCADPPCPEICYSFREPINREIVLGNTENTLANQITIRVATEDYDFHSFYFAKVKTFSLSPEGYEFWNSLVSQQQIEGSIFDPQITEIEGTNIFDTETQAPIIGYFGASTISTDSLFFNRFEGAGFLAPIPTARNSCTEVWRAATLDVPPQFF